MNGLIKTKDGTEIPVEISDFTVEGCTLKPLRCHGTGGYFEHGQWAACPCAICAQVRSEWIASASGRVTVQVERTPETNSFFDPERPTRRDRKVIGIGDWICKIVLILIAFSFLYSVVHAVVTGAVERLVR